MSLADLHCHSSASEVSRLGVQRAMGLPECATPPEEVYALAKRRGMDFVTITDHDTIDGVLSIADRPDVFVSEELTAHFRGEPQAVHVLCYGIAPEDHEWLQAHNHDVEACAEYMNARDIVCALAHPYYTVAAPLTPRHRRRLVELFGIWEVRNGARARELNRPAAIYIATHDGVGVGGSDDHAGVDIGRTFTETPPARTCAEYLEHLRGGRTRARGEQGSAAKWAHAAIALAARALGARELGARALGARELGARELGARALSARELGARELGAGALDTGAGGLETGRGTRAQTFFTDTNQLVGIQKEATTMRASPAPAPSPQTTTPGSPPPPPDPRTVMRMAERLLREGDARQGATGNDLTPDDARQLLRAWLDAVGLREDELIGYMQAEEFTHADLYRRACRAHERKLGRAVAEVAGAVEQGGGVDLTEAATTMFAGCIAAIPYGPAVAFLGAEKAKLDSREGEVPRVAVMADGIASTHGVSRTIEEIRARGVRGYEIEVIGTDPGVDRRLPAVAELDVPLYPGLRIGVPGLPATVETLAEGAFDAIHICSPGPIGIAGALVARGLGKPLIGSYHTELTAYAALRSGDPNLANAMDMAVRTLYGACDLVLSPSPASDEVLEGLGIAPARIARWDRGVDCSRFDPALRGERALGGERAPGDERVLGDERAPGERVPGEELNVLYSGRITKEKGAELLADAFLEAHGRDPRLHLVLAGGGPEEERLRERLGEHATFLGWREGAELAKVYANADIFLFPSATDTFGQVILEAQASGLPVVAVGVGGPTSLIEHRVSGLLCEPTRDALAEGVLELAGSPLQRRRLAAVALTGVRRRTWEAALERLGEGYRRVLATPRYGEVGENPPSAPRTIGERSEAVRRAASAAEARRAA